MDLIKVNNIPNDWIWTNVNEVSSLIRGVTYKKNESINEYKKGYLPVLRATNINDNKIILEDLIYVPKSRIKNEQIIQKNDVIITTSSGSKHLVGKSAQSSIDFHGSFGVFCGLLRPSPLINPKYFGYYFQTPFYQKSILDLTMGVNINNLRRGDIESLLFPIPPADEQVRIVGRVEELFSRLDAGVRSLQAAQTQLEQYRQSTLKQAYIGKLTQKWRQKNEINFDFSKEEIDIEPYKNLITWEIPNEWKWVSLGILIESMQNGLYKPKKFYSDDGIACLRMYNIEDGKIVWKDIKRMILTEDEFKKFLLKPEDILINRVNSRELVGKSAVIPSNIEPSVYESKNIRMRLKPEIVLSYYVQYWMYFFSSRYFNLNAQQVVGMASINQTQISNMPFPLTTIEEQKKITVNINEINSYIERIQNTIEKNLLLNNHLKNSILKKAFEGCLVPQDPNDEPANFLLERIRAQTVKQRKLI